MAAGAMNDLNNLLTCMYTAGLLDEYFQSLLSFEDASTPDLVRQVVTYFCEDAEQMIRQLTNLLEKPCVDYFMIHETAHTLKGCSASFGAPRVNNVCIQICELSKEKNKQGCLEKLNTLKDEFYDLHNKLQTILQLEQQIRTAYPKK